MTGTAGDLVRDLGELVTLPDVYLRINALLNDPDCSMTDIARAVSQDPAFSLRLLRVANSALYRFPSAVDNVAKAVSIIGTSQIRNLALSMSVAKSFDGLPNDLVSMHNFWRHSLYCALVARHLARRVKRCDADAVFTAGLLHDIGELVIFNRAPDAAREALTLVLDSGDELAINAAEQEVLGFDHAAVGGELARQWKLPALLEECIDCHHDIGRAVQHPREVALVHIANVLALMAEIDTHDPADVEPVDPSAWEIIGLTPDCIEETVSEVRAEIAEVEALFTGEAT